MTPTGSTPILATDTSTGIGQLTELTPGNPTLDEYSDILVNDAVFARVGEIGRVGSYYPGRSIRLWAASAGDEAGVDTHLLDLFEIGAATESKGCVNINSMNERMY